MQYVVSKKYTRGSDIEFAEFRELNDARLFITNKMQSDASLNVKVVYTIYDSDKIIEIFDPDKVNFSSQEQGSQGKTASFRPTPLNTAPRPPGTPQKWIRDEDDEKNKE
jgi:hypothetical protein